METLIQLLLFMGKIIKIVDCFPLTGHCFFLSVVLVWGHMIDMCICLILHLNMKPVL